MTFTLLVLASLAAANVEEKPTVAYDLGLVVGRGSGSRGDLETPQLLNKSWVRVGPEIMASVFPAEWMTLGLAFGYQVGWHDIGNEVLRRNEYSIRGATRFRFLERGAWTQGISFGIAIVLSRAATDSPAYDLSLAPVARKSGNGGVYLAYSPSMHITRNWLLTSELGISAFPSDAPCFEIYLRPGVAYEF